MVLAVALFFVAAAPGAFAQFKFSETKKDSLYSQQQRRPGVDNSILDVADALNSAGPYAGQFDTLIAAVNAADPFVATTLSSKGQFTVFAPTDEAFLYLGLDENNVSTLGPETLKDILLYHVAPGRRYKEDILDAYRIRTLSKGFIFQNSGVLTDALGRESEIIATDVEASNGVIHAINRVLLPFAP